MTTPIVLPREVVERLHNYVTPGFELCDNPRCRGCTERRYLLAALDAALAEPEPFERRSDGALTIMDESFDVIIHRRGGVITIHYYDYVGDDDDNGDAQVEWTANQSRAVALALLALTEEAQR